MNDVSSLGAIKEVRTYREALLSIGAQDIFAKQKNDDSEAVLKLRRGGMSIRNIAKTTGISRSKVGRIVMGGRERPKRARVNIIRRCGTDKNGKK